MKVSLRLPLALLLLTLPSLVARAQATGTVTGVVRDDATGDPLRGATVLVRDLADSTARKLGDVSDSAGAFNVERVPFDRRLVVEVRYVGYDSHLDTVQLNSRAPEASLGTVRIHRRIDESKVQVTAERPQVTVMADKTVYGVEDNTAYTATTVSELLGQIPSVDVDQDGKVSLRGDDRVTIMMNGRPLTMPAEQRNKFLQSLPANTVKSIEVRTSPGAQFNASYEGGVINIVTRRTVSDMIGGNVNAGTDSRLGYNGGAGLFYNNEGLNASVGGGIFNGPGEGNSSSLRVNYHDTNERRSVGSGTSESEHNSSYGYGQIDYSITASDLFSLSFNLNSWGSSFSSRGEQTFYNVRNEVVSRFVDSTNAAEASNSGGYNEGSFLYRHTFNGDHKISLDLSYNGNLYKGDNPYSSVYFSPNGELDSARSATRSTKNNHDGSALITSIDYENPINDTVTLSFGARNERNKLDNSTEVSLLDRATGTFVLDTLQTNHYISENTIYALYGNVAWKPLAALGMQFGLRAERANVTAHYASGVPIISKDYTNIFPSGSLTYTLTETSNLTGTYRRSVALPDIDALNPTRVRWSDFFEFSGNADLEPEFTHLFQLGYSTFWGMGNMISVTPYYSTTVGSIERSQELVDGVTYSTSANFNGSWSLGAEANIMLRPTDWFNIRLSGDLYRKVNRGGPTPGDIYSAAVGYSSNGSLSVDLMEGLNLSGNIFFRMPASVGGSTQSGQSFISFALRQRLLDNKLSLSLRVNDPFNMQGWHSIYETPDFYTEMDNKWSSRFIGLNVSYNFGTTPRMEEHRQDKTETKGGGNGGGGGGGGQ